MSLTNNYQPHIVYYEPIEPVKPVKPGIFKRLFTVTKILFTTVGKSFENIGQGEDANKQVYAIDNREQLEARTKLEILDDSFFDINHTMKNTQYKIERYQYLQAKEQYKFDRRNYKLQQRILKKQRMKMIPSDNESMVTCSEMLDQKSIGISVALSNSSDIRSSSDTLTNRYLPDIKNFAVIEEEKEENIEEEQEERIEERSSIFQSKNAGKIELSKENELIIKLS